MQVISFIWKVFNAKEQLPVAQRETFSSAEPKAQGELIVCDSSRTCVRPHFQNTTKNIKKVESVQRRAARFVTGDYHYTSSVTAITEGLSWETLRHRRQ